eukprot:gene200-427_t
MSGFPCPALGRSNIADKKFAQAPFSRYVVESVSNAHPMPADSAEKLKWADNFGPFSREQVFLAGLRTKRIGDLMQARHLSDGFGEVDQWSGRTWQKRFHGAEVPEDVVTQLPFTEVQKKNAYIRPAKGSYFPCWELNFMQKENVVVPRPKAIKTYHPSKSLLRDDPFWDAPKETPSAPEMRITDTGKYDTVMKTTNGFPRWTILPKKIDPK